MFEMPSIQKTVLRALSLFFIVLPSLSPVVADDLLTDPEYTDYIYQLIPRYPNILRTWQSIVPDKYRNEEWIENLNGTSGGVYLTFLEGTPFLAGDMCLNDSCYGNNITYLISLESSEAYGMIQSEAYNVSEFWGPVNSAAKSLVRHIFDVFRSAEETALEPSKPILTQMNEIILRDPELESISEYLKNQTIPSDHMPKPSLHTVSKACQRFPNLC